MNATDLSGHDLLLPAGELSKLPEVRWLASLPRARVVFRANSYPALVEAALAGEGIMPLPLGWGEREPGLERVLVLERIGKRKDWLVTHESASRRPDVKVVAQQIGAIFERMFARA